MANRRRFLQSVAGWGAGLFAGRAVAQQGGMQGMPGMDGGSPEAHPAAAVPVDAARRHAGKAAGLRGSTVPVVTTDVGDLAYVMDGEVKVFHLVAQVLEQKISPDKTIAVWGYNGSAPGPTIQVTEGDKIRVIFDNELPEPTSIHWHGFEDHIRYDGQPGISQEPVKPGGRFIYEFGIHQEGTYFYHSHMAMQEMAGMLGAFVMHPREPYKPHCEKDFVLHLQEYAVLPNNTVPNTMNMEYNWLVLNGKAGPACTPLIVKQGERVRIRFVNLGMDHHPMHMHGHTWHVTGTEGGRIQESAWWPGNTVLVGVAQTRMVEFEANNPGDWMIHCHLPHHMMNQMSSNVGRMTRGMTGNKGMPAGIDMESGMGMPQGQMGTPMGDDSGASLGRGMGFGSTADMQKTNGGMNMQLPPGDVAQNANQVPNFPQDAYMEGPRMNMDAMVAKPENYGLRPGWSEYMMGMMTFVRVLSAADYDVVMGKMRDAGKKNDPYAAVMGVKA